MELGYLIPATVTILGLALLAYGRSAGRRRKGWKAVAARYSGHYSTEGEILFGVGTIEGPVGAVRFSARVERPKGGGARITTVEAAFAAPWCAASYSVYPTGMMAFTRNMQGAKFVAFSEGQRCEKFDRKYVAEASARVAAADAIGLEARQAIARFPRPGVAVLSDGIKVKVKLLGLDPKNLARGIDLVGELAGYGSHVVGILRDLPGGTFQPAASEPGTARAEIHGAVRIVLEACRRDGRPVLVATCERTMTGPAQTGDVLPEEARALLVHVGSAAVNIDERAIGVVWSPSQVTRERVLAGVRLLERTVSPTLGVYR